MPKISQLTALTTPDSGDELPIVDVSTSTTKKITRTNLLKGAPLPADTVDTQSIDDGAVTYSKISTGSDMAWSNYVPTITNLTVGSGTLTSRYIQLGKTVHYSGRFIFGSGSSIGGVIIIPMPVNAHSSYQAHEQLGTSITYKGATNAIYGGQVLYTGSNALRISIPITQNASNPVYVLGVSTSWIATSVPAAWSSGHYFSWNITYEAA